MRIALPKSLNDVESSSFDPIDPGTYDFRVTGCEQKTSKSSGNPYLNIELTVINDDDFDNRKVFDIISLQENSLWKLKEFAASCGVDIDDEFDTEDFIDEEVTAVVDIEVNDQYGDKNRVKAYKS